MEGKKNLGKPEKLSSKKGLLVLLLLLLFVGLASSLPTFKRLPVKETAEVASKVSNLQESGNSQEVLGRNYQAPEIFIYGGESQYNSGGMIALASTDEPAVWIDGYKISGSAEVAVYLANENVLIDYLTHDKDGKQTKTSPDISSLQYVTTVKNDLNTGYYEGTKITLPLQETGIWYLKVKVGSTEVDAFVIRSNIGVLTEEGDNEFVFWGQNFKTRRSVSDGNIKILNLEDSRQDLQEVSFNADGIARAAITADADIALVQQNSDFAIVPLNLKYLNTGYSFREFQPKRRLTRYFIFTDRPLYKPGDTVYFKAVLRDDDDARYTIPGGEATARVYADYYYDGSDIEPVFEKNFTVSADGTINGEYKVPENSDIGSHYLTVSVPNQSARDEGGFWNSEWSSNTISFDVEFFRKPEFAIEVTTPQSEFIAGDKVQFTISGLYFSGQPLVDQQVKYSVYASSFYEYQYETDQQKYSQNISDAYRYGSYYNRTKVTEGTATLNASGQAEIEVDTKIANSGKSQVFAIEATLQEGSITPSFARRNVLVYAGEYGIYRKDSSYGAQVNTPLSLPVVLIPYGDAGLENITLTAKIHRENWISYQEANKKYPSYKKEEEDLPNITAKTDSQGNAVFTFTPKKIGSYTMTIEGKDARGNTISKIFYSYVSEIGQPYFTQDGSNELTIAADKQKYQPTETATFSIFSEIPDRDVFLSLERGRVNRFQIVHLSGKNGKVEIPLVNTDVPNIYAKVASFSNYALDSTIINVPVSPDSKKLVVAITPSSTTFGPGETVTVNVSTTDIVGNPVSAELALWAVDKAIFEISDNRLGDIFTTFWKERSNTTQEAHSLEGILVNQAEGGGCFAAGTSVLMADGSYKNIEDVQVGDYVQTRSEKDPTLVAAQVLNTHQTEENGYLILNGNLKVTANHIMWINGSWQEAGNAQIGDMLVDSKGNSVYVSSIEWQKGKFKVYNLEIEKYQTFFAGGFWVHNQKGEARNAFKDTAYWNPSLHTDSSGRAQVSFKLPDNLTTWTLAAVGTTADTKVGQTTSEIVVTKDVIVRPILPNILRTGDEIVLSALVQNFTQDSHPFDVSLDFDSGEVEQKNQTNVTLDASQTQQFYWKVKPTAEKDKAKLTFAAESPDSSDLSDIITQEIPVRPFGFTEIGAQTGDGAKSYDVKLAGDINREKSKVTLSLSPTIIGTLPTAMKYLIGYPYGCTEQTTSRFVPAIIAQTNQDLFAEALADVDINDIVETGIAKLKGQQHPDGGWAWWFTGYSDPFVTTYVAEYLLYAKQAGFDVDEQMLSQTEYYLSHPNPNAKLTTKDQVALNYALALFGVENTEKKITDLKDLSSDSVSFIVMTNYLNGDTDPESNGLNHLVGMAQTQGDSVFWESGDKLHFGSKDASTALAIRALLLAGGDREMAVKGVRYLTRSRQFNYWSNTYATSQVIRTLVEFSKTGSELDPNYSYTVELDGNQIAEGSVNSSKQLLKDVEIPIADIKSGGSTIAITQNGEGQIYSTLLVNQFHTDRNSPAKDHGLEVSREYVNEKGEQYSLAVGDTALVKITVDGLSANENYGVINDELPSGLVPINESFKNEQYGRDFNDHYTTYGVSDREVTENGMVLSLYRIAAGKNTYTYRARVVSEGTFIVPPATAALMYAPEIYGRSEVQTLKVTKESKVVPEKIASDLLKRYAKHILIATLILLILFVEIVIAKKQGKTFTQFKDKLKSTFKKKNQQPPAPPQTQDSEGMPPTPGNSQSGN